MTGWPKVLLGLLVVKVVYLAAVVVALRLWPAMDEGRFYGVTQRWPRGGDPVFASHFATWDGAHYLFLSEVGYAARVPSCAFYPLWPLLIRWGAVFTGGSHVLVGMVLANLMSLAAWVLFHRVVAARFGARVAGWAVVWLVVFPGSLFYQFIYSEPVFLLLVMVLWWGLERGRYGWAWTAAGLLPLARGIGVFCVLPIAWHALSRNPPRWLRGRRWWAKGRSDSGAWDDTTAINLGVERGSDLRAPRDAGVESWRAYALVLAPLLGWGAYLALMGQWTGNPFEGIEAQKHWAVHSIGNLVNVPKFVIGLFHPTEWHAFRGSLLDRCVFILLLYTLPVQWRLGKDLLVWTYVLGVLPAMSGTFTSYTRFASCSFPVFVALAAFFDGPRMTGVRPAGAGGPNARFGAWLGGARGRLRWALLVTLGVLHAVLLWRFVNFRWAG